MLKLSTLQSLIARNKMAIKEIEFEIKDIKCVFRQHTLMQKYDDYSYNWNEETSTQYQSQLLKDLQRNRKALKNLVCIQKELKKEVSSIVTREKALRNVVKTSEDLKLYEGE